MPTVQYLQPGGPPGIQGGERLTLARLRFAIGETISSPLTLSDIVPTIGTPAAVWHGGTETDTFAEFAMTFDADPANDELNVQLISDGSAKNAALTTALILTLLIWHY